jgi:hypothetical protein
MGLRKSNAAVSVSSGATPRLTNARAQIGVPSPRDQQLYGGIVRYLILLDPLPAANTVVEGDTLTIQSWAGQVVDSSRVYHVLESMPSGSGSLVAQRVVVGTRQYTG